MSEQTNNEVQLTIGQKLRQLTSKARSEAEISKFYAVLEETALTGGDKVHFTDLRQYLNNMIMSGTVWDWLKSQDLMASGAINQETGAYDYVIYWSV